MWSFGYLISRAYNFYQRLAQRLLERWGGDHFSLLFVLALGCFFSIAFVPSLLKAFIPPRITGSVMMVAFIFMMPLLHVISAEWKKKKGQ